MNLKQIFQIFCICIYCCECYYNVTVYRECGCGEGDSGCAECGCCRICAKENVDNSELAILGPSGAGDMAGMMRLDLIFGGQLLLVSLIKFTVTN